jgi:zinc and cadmium transporter
MPDFLLNSLVATTVIGLMSLVGVVGFVFSDSFFKKISLFIVAFSTGALLGGAFLHLLPESISEIGSVTPYLYLLLGVIVFYVLERILKWHHCHDDEGDCGVHTFTYMSLIGDSVHNFIDGLVIVAAFFISPEVGIASVVAIASHEIPQELGDFAVLVHGGFSKTKALVWNLLSAATALIGVVVGYFLVNNIENISLALLPFAAGGFIYVSMSDLIPELHKESSLKRSLINFLMFVVGLAFMYFTKVSSN